MENNRYHTNHQVECKQCDSSIDQHPILQEYCSMQCAKEKYFLEGKTFESVSISDQDICEYAKKNMVRQDHGENINMLEGFVKVVTSLEYVNRCTPISRNVNFQKLKEDIDSFKLTEAKFGSGYVFEAMVLHLYQKYKESEEEELKDGSDEAQKYERTRKILFNRQLFWHAFHLYSLTILPLIKNGDIFGAGLGLDENERLIVACMLLFEGAVRFQAEKIEDTSVIGDKTDIKIEKMKGRFHEGYGRHYEKVRTIYFKFCNDIPGIDTLVMFCSLKPLENISGMKQIKIFTENSLTYQELQIMPEDQNKRLNCYESKLEVLRSPPFILKEIVGDTTGKYERLLRDHPIEDLLDKDPPIIDQPIANPPIAGQPIKVPIVKCRHLVHVGLTYDIIQQSKPIYLKVGNQQINWMILTYGDIIYKEIVEHATGSVKRLPNMDQGTVWKMQDETVLAKTINKILEEMGKTVEAPEKGTQIYQFIDLTQDPKFTINFLDSKKVASVIEAPKHPEMYQREIMLCDDIVKVGRKQTAKGGIVMLYSWNDNNKIFKPKIIANGVWYSSREPCQENIKPKGFDLRCMMKASCKNDFSEFELITEVNDNNGGVNNESSIVTWRIQMSKEERVKPKKLGDSIERISNIMIYNETESAETISENNPGIEELNAEEN